MKRRVIWERDCFDINLSDFSAVTPQTLAEAIGGGPY